MEHPSLHEGCQQRGSSCVPHGHIYVPEVQSDRTTERCRGKSTCIFGLHIWMLVLFAVLASQVGGQPVQLEQYNLDLFVREDAPVGTPVGEVAGPAFRPPYARWISKTSDNKTFSRFLVDLDTGWIIIKGGLDREEQDQHTIIISTSFTSPKLVIINVQVLDVNDISPTFTSSFINVSVSESAPVGHRIPLGSVRDEDLGDNTTQRVEIVSGNEENDFVLEVRSRSSVEKTVDLVVKYQLDYERTISYNVLVRASDGGGRFSEVRAQIDILDQNDNEPIFNASKYSARIPENVTVGTQVLQVYATDTDSGDNSRIAYSVLPGSDPDQCFSINETTGVVRVNKPLDYETRDRYSLTLEASDHGVSPQRGMAALEIIVENVSEQLGSVKIEFQPSFSGGHVREDTPVGSQVATISVDGSDTAGVSSDLDVSLYRSHGYFTVKAGAHLGLYVSSQLDRERIPNFEMTLHVEDSGSPPLRANKVIKVVIDDVNDNPPVFSRSEYFAVVQETAAVGTEVIRVSATDDDVGKNAKITYHIEDSFENMGWFAVEPSTGAITTRERVDCDLNPHPTLVIVATDGGSPPRMASAQVVISVQDTGSKDPEFETSFYSVRIAENRRVGDCILTVSATDPECGTRSALTYRMAQFPASPKEFRVEATSGAICIQSGLDYEVATSYYLLVEAVDEDGRTAQAVVQVEITDVNDNSPRFEPKEYWINVMSSTQPSQLLTVQARDLDSGMFGTVSYSITEGNDQEYFDINAHTGAIFLKKHLPDKESMFKLRILATDGGGMTSHDPAQIRVSVISGELHPLVFTRTVFNFSIDEDAPVGHLVGQVKASYDDPGDDLEIVYSSQFQNVDWFRIDRLSGSIYTKSTLDRELHPFVIISIEAQTGFPPVSAVAQANVTILDVNDNEPYFPVTAMLEIEVWENAKVGSVLYVAWAHDKDLGNNGTVRYQLHEQPSNTFTIDDQTGEIHLTRELDYEQQREYLLVVSAEDLGTPARLSSTMSLVMKVKDVNDNPPMFDQAEYEFYVPENVDVGHPVGRVTARDGDSGHNKLISFSLRNNSCDFLFRISPAEGVIFTDAVLDREQQEMYELTVEAADHGNPFQLSATATVRIIVTDINDHDPVFSKAEYRFHIYENLEQNTLVGQVFAQDLDSGDSGQIYYSFCQPQTTFSINQENGEIRTRTSLDRELLSEHDITICVSDNGHPPKTAVAKVKVKVKDDNDNFPVFQRSNPLFLNVSENRRKGTEVVSLLAVDFDEGDNALVNYFFDKDNSEDAALAHFKIHKKSGQLTTEEVLDYETQNVYHLTVVARDSGQIFLQSSLILIISVLNENDQAFHSHINHVSFYCLENTAIGTTVGQVRSNNEGFQDVTFVLVGGNVFSLFSIDHISGIISVLGDVDYEKSSSHFLNIQVLDGSLGLPRDNIGITINVVDVNDERPVFEQDPVIIQGLAENMPVNHVVHKFAATDKDSGLNGTVRYSIHSSSTDHGDVTTYFNINHETGELFISRNIDFEIVKQITIIVKAEDTCPYLDHIQHSLVTMVISVSDANDNAPEFVSADSLTISEDEAVGSLILLVVAVDRDSDVDGSGNNVVRYSIMSGNEEEKFVLAVDTGLLTLNGDLDYETQTNYVLNVSAEDMGNPKMVSFQYLHIKITDVNDNAPLFSQSTYYAVILENSDPGTPVIEVLASDADTGDNSELTYLLPYDHDGKFTIDAKTGLITTSVQLDREVKDLYTLTVFARDGVLPVHYSSCSIIISVLDENDNGPVFENQQVNLDIPENRAESSVLTLLASDSDFGDNARINYAITGGNDGRFKIDPERGNLSVEALDREVHSSYNLTVTATDQGNNPQAATAYITITVLDENDHSPVFDDTVYTVSVPEDTREGVLVLTVTAKDDDESQNGHVIYSLGSGTDGHFVVNSSTGELYTNRVFDRERVSNYSFLIMASDRGISGPRNSTAQVVILITDINDNPPRFPMVPYTASLNMFTPPNTHILTVTAHDSDLGSNGEVEYSLQAPVRSSEILENFYLDKKSGKLYTRNTWIRAPGHYRLLVMAMDRASYLATQLSSTGVIEITVGSEPQSDRLFQFSYPEYSAEIPEHYGLGNSVISVAATLSSDLAQPRSTTYSFISGYENGAFSIDATTGQISVAEPAFLDFETVSRIHLIVEALSADYRAYASVLITLTDINDNSPKFSQAIYETSIWENNAPETFVIQVVAYDADAGSNGEIIYSVIGGDEDHVFTFAKPDVGILVTSSEAAPLDREARVEGYRLTIEARDRGDPSKFSTCTLIITIIDKNDTPPFFPEIGPRNVSEKYGIGQTVVMATANDVDLNPVLIYDFTTEGNPDNTFSLDRLNGHLTLAKSLDYEQKSHYSVGVQVSDGNPDHVQSTWIDVYVDDENDNAPVLSQSTYEVTLPEGTGPHKSVVTVKALDADSGDNAAVRYTLAQPAAESFYINATTGAIYTRRTVTFRYEEPAIQLLVVVTDGGMIVQSAAAVVHVQITSTNSHTPKFLQATGYIAHISESAQRGHEVLRVSAVDEDSGHCGDKISYALSGPGSDMFLIHPRTGSIFYSGGINFEMRKNYSLTVVASDQKVPSKSVSVPVTIFVEDWNDNPPVFEDEQYSVTVDEDFESVKEFLTVHATDADSGSSAEIKFYIRSGNDEGIFHNPDNRGSLIIKEGMHLNYELQSSYRLIIQAVDCNGCSLPSPCLSSLVTIDVSVRDINEFRPRFPVKHCLQDMKENSHLGTAVFRAHANDDDGGEMGVLTYALLDELDYQKFTIDEVSGEVTTRFVFDYEADRASHLYNLVIVASDRDQQCDTMDLTIRVVDVDEFDPLLTDSEYKFEVPGSAVPGDFVGQVLASDDDGGEAGRVVYTFLEISDYFSMNPFNGSISVVAALQSDLTMLKQESSKRKRTLVLDRQELTIQVSSGMPESRQATARCTIIIDRACPGCAAPVHEVRVTVEVDGGIVAGIVVACAVVIILVILGILLVLYRHRSSGKSIPIYFSNSSMDVEHSFLPIHSQAERADIVRISHPHPNNHLESSSFISGEDTSADEEENYEDISGIITDISQTFNERFISVSGTQQDDDISQSRFWARQEYFASLANSSVETMRTRFLSDDNGANNLNRLYPDSVQRTHHYLDEGGGESDIDEHEILHLEDDRQAVRFETQVNTDLLVPNTRNLKHLFSKFSHEEKNDLYTWNSVINWSPQYEPLAEVFLEIGRMKNENITNIELSINSAIHPQTSSVAKQPKLQTDPAASLTRASPVVVSLPGGVLNTRSEGYRSQSSATDTSHKPCLYAPPSHFVNSRTSFSNNGEQKSVQSKSVHICHGSQNVTKCHIHKPCIGLQQCTSTCSLHRAQQHSHVDLPPS